MQKKGIRGRARLIVAGKKDYIITLISFVSVTIVSFFFLKMASDPTLNIAMLYTIGAFIAARYTEGYLYGIIYALGAVLAVNFFFTYPYGTLNFGIEGYHVTFLGMLIISLFTSVSSSLLKSQQDLLSKQEKELAEAEKEKMRANLLRAVSHDLRTPLTGIIGNSESILENGENMTDEEKMGIVSSIDSDARWLLNMVENLLSVTRINNETARVKKTEEPVEEVMAEAVARLKKRLPEASVKVSIPDEFIMIPMDAILIEQVLINLMENAIVHAESPQPVECYTKTREDAVEFHVRDYGIGIPEERMDSIFDGATRTDARLSDSRKGMGIGLTICKTIVLAHGGEIFAKNCNPGAEFWFTLPREKKEENAAARN